MLHRGGASALAPQHCAGACRAVGFGARFTLAWQLTTLPPCPPFSVPHAGPHCQHAPVPAVAAAAVGGPSSPCSWQARLCRCVASPWLPRGAAMGRHPPLLLPFYRSFPCCRSLLPFRRFCKSTSFSLAFATHWAPAPLLRALGSRPASAGTCRAARALLVSLPDACLGRHACVKRARRLDRHTQTFGCTAGSASGRLGH